MRRPLLASGLLLVLFAAAGTAVIAQPRRPQRPPTGDAATHTDASSDGAAAPQATDAAAVADASLASSADVAVTAATLEDGGVLVGDAAIPMRQVGTGTVIHFPVPEQLARTAVPVFVQIRSSAPIDHVSLFFRGVGARRYTELRMSALGQQFRLPSGYGALIPCDDIFPPRVEYYVTAIDQSNTSNGGAGSADAPVQVPIVERRSFAAPTLPGLPPPRTCGSLAATASTRDAGAAHPVVERGTADLGEPCQVANDCRRGLRCGQNHQCLFDR